MIKFVYCLRRREDVPEAEFHRYWREVHGPLVASHAEVLKIRRYVQVHTVSTPVNASMASGHGAPEAYDGVAELWWDSIDDFGPHPDLPEEERQARERAAQILFEDEQHFIDHSRSPLFLAEEHPVIA